MMARTFKIWLAALLFTALIVWLCVVWLDRPIALWVHAIFGGKHIPVAVTESPFSSISIATACVFVIAGIVAISGRLFSRLEATIAMCAISTLATIIVKDQLKHVFGRTWPDTWAPGVLSLLHNGAYGFHYFHAGKSYQSFPSGHAAVAAAVLSVPWLLSAKLRPVCTILMIAVDIALVALNLHFLSDVIAGTFVGFSIGLFTVALWRATSSKLNA